MTASPTCLSCYSRCHSGFQHPGLRSPCCCALECQCRSQYQHRCLLRTSFRNKKWEVFQALLTFASRELITNIPRLFIETHTDRFNQIENRNMRTFIWNLATDCVRVWSLTNTYYNKNDSGMFPCTASYLEIFLLGQNPATFLLDKHPKQSVFILKHRMCSGYGFLLKDWQFSRAWLLLQ